MHNIRKCTIVSFDLYMSKHLTQKDRLLIKERSVQNNIFFALFFINLFAQKELYSKLLIKSYSNLSCDNVSFCANEMLDGYLTVIKEILNPTLCFEYNLYKESIKNIDFNDFICDVCNEKEWINYYFEKYPVLKEKIIQIIVLGIEFIMKFIHDLNEDLLILRDKLQIQESSIKSIEISQGDFHNNMAGVIKINFKKKSIYYKPRDLNNELFIYSFFEFLKKRGLKKSIIIPATISLQDHGWMEHIPYKDYVGKNEINDFYYFQGINLSVFYFIGADDLISDNIIAQGKYPCYFDLECILQPYISNVDKTTKIGKTSHKFLSTSVLKTKLLPMYSFQDEDFQGISISGLSSITEKIPSYNIQFKDGYFSRLCKKSEFEHNEFNIPKCKLNKETKNDSKYKVQKIIEGFKDCYSFMYKNRNLIIKFLKDNGQNKTCRYLYRPTNVYSRLSEESNLPHYLSSKEKQNKLFEKLFNGENEKLQNRNIICSEYAQMKQQDIPIFYANSTSRSLIDKSQKQIQGKYFDITGLELALNKLNKASKNDLQNQIKLIELSFAIHEDYSIGSNTVKGKYFSFENELDKKKDLNLESIRKKIKSKIDNIPAKLKNKSIDNTYDSCEYFDLVQGHKSIWQIINTNWGLFDGLDGHSFFYLNYFLIFKNNNILEKGTFIINEGIKHFLTNEIYYKKIKGFNKISIMNFPLSTFYIAEFYIENGIKIKNINEEAIEKILDWIREFYKQDFDYDVMGGGAGSTIYLLKLYNRTKNKSVLNLAIKIAKRLCDKATSEKGYLCWYSKFNKAHTGFCHGSSGFSYIFAKLIKQVDNPKNKELFSNALIKSLKYEERLFNSDKKHWSIFKFQEEEKAIDDTNHYWAYGSGAIAQSRLLIMKHFKADYLKEQLEIAIRNIKVQGTFANMNFSSGTFGNIDILYSYAKIYNDFKLKNNILYYLDIMLDEMLEDNDWACAPIGKNSFYEMNGLFTGILGVGNVLLNIYDFEKTCKLFD